MKGTRPLDNDEIRRVSTCFTGTFQVRNRGLFMLGVSTGGRISELLSLTIGDVYQNGKAVSDLLFDKSIVKGGEVSRACQPKRQACHRRPYPLAPGEVRKTRCEASLVSVSQQKWYRRNEQTDGTRDAQTGIYRRGTQRQTRHTQPP